MKGWKLLKTFMAENFVSEDDFFNSRFSEHVAIRVKAINHLKAAGLSGMDISRVMNCDHSLVRYWSNETARNVKRSYNLDHYRRRRKYSQLAAALEELYA